MPEARRSHQLPASSAANGLSIAAVTAVIKHLIENGLAGRNVTSQLGGDVMISAQPPDRIPSGSDERAQLNIFLHQVTPHTSVRLENGNGALPRPAVAVELHYLVTAYGAQDFQSEILLGHAIDILHANAKLDSASIRESLNALTSGTDRRVVPPSLATLAASDVAERVESIQITPEFLDAESISRLWSALQARFRPSATYKVTAVPLVAASAHP
jgi:hypothetical protein